MEEVPAPAPRPQGVWLRLGPGERRGAMPASLHLRPGHTDKLQGTLKLTQSFYLLHLCCHSESIVAFCQFIRVLDIYWLSESMLSFSNYIRIVYLYEPSESSAAFSIYISSVLKNTFSAFEVTILVLVRQ